VGDSVGVSEVARTTGLAKSTCSRILSSLDELGIVERVDEAGRYVIGSGLRALAAAGAPVGTLRDLAEPYLRELAGRLGESAALSVMDGGEGLYVTQVAAPGPVQVTDWTGQRFPLHTIAAGQAFMGSWTDEQLAGYAANGLAEYTERTVTTLVGLRQRVGEVRRRGVAWTLGEFSEEITGVAAPVCDPDGEAVASVSVYGPGWRFPGDADTTEIERLVGETAERVGGLLA
jgi:DNA-binding IclR family transcriptional regulator